MPSETFENRLGKCDDVVAFEKKESMKQTFKQIGKSYAAAAAEIGCSKPMLVAVVNHGQWPKKKRSRAAKEIETIF